MAREGSPRFLIARLSAIGDTVLTLPVLCALREAYPDAFIAWVVERAAAPILENHACLDELVVLPRGWLESPRTVWNVRGRLRALHVDVGVDPQGRFKSSVGCWLAAARSRLGMGGLYGRGLGPRLNNRW